MKNIYFNKSEKKELDNSNTHYTVNMKCIFNHSFILFFLFSGKMVFVTVQLGTVVAVGGCLTDI